MKSAAFAIPGDINLPTGGYAYDRRMLALLPKFGVAASHLSLPGGFPAPTALDLAETRRLLAGIPADTVALADGLAYGALPPEVINAVAGPVIALVHHPLCLEAGLSKEQQDKLFALEKVALSLARRIVVTSAVTADTLAGDFAVPREKIRVAEPGTDPAPRARGTGYPSQLLSVGSVVPRKAFDVLVRALASAADRDWKLTIVGPIDRCGDALAAVQRALQETNLGRRVTLAGPVDPAELDGYYAAADIFVLSSLYEGYGMVLGEAMARGLPIVCTTGGAAAATVPDGAALKVAPGDAAALGSAICRVLDDPDLRRAMSDAAWAAGQKLPRWEDTARIIAGVIKEVAP